MEGGDPRTKWRSLAVAVFLAVLYGGTVSGMRKGQRGPVGERYEVAHVEEGACVSAESASDLIQRNLSAIREDINDQIEQKIRELSDMLLDFVAGQAECNLKKLIEVRESTECKEHTTQVAERVTSSPASPSVPVCDSINCRDLSSKMLDLIDHSAEPCQDFYQYACGGVEKDVHLFPEDVEYDVDRRIREKLETLDASNPIMGSARTFYDACLLREEGSASRESLLYAKEVVRRVGRFLPAGSADSDSAFKELPRPTNLTHMLSFFMKSHFTPLFEVSVDPDASAPLKFLPRISLAMEPSRLFLEADLLACLHAFREAAKKARRESDPSFDLNDQYDEYRRCKNTKGLDTKLTRMVESISAMNLLDYVADLTDRNDLLQETKQNTELLLNDINSKLPLMSDIKSAYLSKSYQVNDLQGLSAVFGNQIDWGEFLFSLSGKRMSPDQKILVYHQKELAEILTIIGNEWNLDPTAVHNSLLMLWSERVYSDLVSPMESTKDYCIQAAKILLPDLSSVLYLHSFPDVKLTRLQRTIKGTVRSIQSTFATMLKGTDEQVNSIKRKIDAVQVNVGAYLDASSRNASLMEGVQGMTLNASHAFNMDFLLRRVRRLLYSLLNQPTNSPRAMWIKGIVPFEKRAFIVHETNSMYLPVAIFNPPYFFFRKGLPDYITSGGLGHVISRLFVKLLDGTGLEFDGSQKKALDIPLSLISPSECLSEQLNADFPLENDDGFSASYKMPKRNYKLNDLMSNSGAVRLAWLTYLKSFQDSDGPLPSLVDSEEDHLIWIGHEPLQPIRAFFIRIAQTQCRSSSEFDLLQVNEDEKILPRHRINLSFKNEQLFSGAFQCKKGSPMSLDRKCPFLPFNQHVPS